MIDIVICYLLIGGLFAIYMENYEITKDTIKYQFSRVSLEVVMWPGLLIALCWVALFVFILNPKIKRRR
jgi:hypothetical protein